MSSDPYAALGLTKTAANAEIKKAYRKIAKESHPDLNPGDSGAEERFKAAAAAYELLKDPKTRARFDKGEIDASGAERPERHFYREYTDSPQHNYYTTQGFGDLGDESDLFAEILRQRGAGGFGEQRQSGAGLKARGPDMRFALGVGFLDAVRGSKQRIALPTGEPLQVTIPEGTADGQTIRLRGKGGEGFSGGSRGDALVTLHVRPHKVFRREGDDIHITLPITLDEAVLGGRVSTPTIDGSVGLSIPAGSSGGKVLRMRQRGAKGTKGKGDQLVELQIVLPDGIDDALKSFMEEWRSSHHYDPRKGVTE